MAHAPQGGIRVTEQFSLAWRLVEAGVYTAVYRGVELRCRWTKSGWIVSRRDGDEWLGLTGDVRRADAEAKAIKLVGE